jgi:hypothetical protein
MKQRALILLTFIAMISCDDKDKDININSYPMNIGTEWIYDRQLIVKKYESETSDKIIDIDTINFTDKVWIDKDTVLNDTMNVKVFRSRENNNNWTSNEYKFIDNEGLKNYAYSNSEAINVYAKGKVYLKFSNGLGKVASEGIIFIIKPTLDIKLPLDRNSSWTFMKSSDIQELQIDKNVIGTERVNLIGQNFDCFKIEWVYLNEPALEDIKVTDWISEKGLIKRIRNYGRTIISDEDGEPLYFGQLIETMTIKSITIK